MHPGMTITSGCPSLPHQEIGRYMVHRTLQIISGLPDGSTVAKPSRDITVALTAKAMQILVDAACKIGPRL